MLKSGGGAEGEEVTSGRTAKVDRGRDGRGGERAEDEGGAGGAGDEALEGRALGLGDEGLGGGGSVASHG